VLREEILPRLTMVLTKSFEAEDSRMNSVVTFKNDEQSNSRHLMSSIKAVISHPPKTRRTFLIEKWLDLYRSQPWLAKQNAVENLERGRRAGLKKELDKKKFLTGKQAEEVRKEVSERSERALRKEDEHTRDGSRKMAETATST